MPINDLRIPFCRYNPTIVLSLVILILINSNPSSALKKIVHFTDRQGVLHIRSPVLQIRCKKGNESLQSQPDKKTHTQKARKEQISEMVPAPALESQTDSKPEDAKSELPSEVSLRKSSSVQQIVHIYNTSGGRISLCKGGDLTTGSPTRNGGIL